MSAPPELTQLIERAAAAIRATGAEPPRLGIVLGSGLGGFAQRFEAAAVLAYETLPGFPAPGVAGHGGRLILGRAGGLPVAVLQGRAHYYETGRADAMAVPIRTLAALRCKSLLLTNAAGSLRPAAGPGSVMLITDHINFLGASPLLGATGNTRFLDMTRAYDPGLCAALRAAAAKRDIALHEGVYAWVGGPQFETPAEIRALQGLGADAVGMSTVPEVILARHAGLRVVALSLITNLGAGMGETALSHEQTVAEAGRAAEQVQDLVLAFLAELAAEAT